MALSSMQLLSRSSFSAEAGKRRSLETTFGARSTGRTSVDMRANRADAAGATATLPVRQGDDVHLEVGRSVDFNEQRRRLEQFWNTEELNRSSSSETNDESDGRVSANEEGTSAVDTRLHLEQRWQTQSSQDDLSDYPRCSRNLGQPKSSKQGRLSVRPRRVTSGQSRCSERKRQKLKTAAAEEADLEFLQTLSRSLVSEPTQQRRSKQLLLQREAELRLGRIVQLGLQTRKLLDAAESHLGRSLLPAEQQEAVKETYACIQLRLSNQFLAQQLFIKYNIGLLRKVVRAYEGRGLETDDLYIEGLHGLEKAILKFDPKKGFKFSTYAYSWIRQAVGFSICEDARLVRLPAHIYAFLGRIHKARQDLSKQYAGREVSDEQIAAVVGLPVEKLLLYEKAGKQPSSLDQLVSTQLDSRTTTTRAETVQDTHPAADEEILEQDAKRLLEQDVDTVLSGLSLRERNILRYRYGLHTDAFSLADLSAAYGLSKERVRHIGEVALAKLQLRQSSKGVSSSGIRSRNVPLLRPEIYGYI